MAGIFFVAPRKNDRSGMTAINRGFFLSAIFSLVLVVIASFVYLPSSFSKLRAASPTRRSCTTRAIRGCSPSARW